MLLGNAVEHRIYLGNLLNAHLGWNASQAHLVTSEIKGCCHTLNARTRPQNARFELLRALMSTSEQRCHLGNPIFQ
jgi:hypothetical protein